MFKLLFKCTHLTCSQSNAQNSPNRLKRYVSRELPDVQAGFRKGRGTRDQVANIHWIIEKARENFRKTSSALLITPKPFLCRSQQTGKF